MLSVPFCLLLYAQHVLLREHSLCLLPFPLLPSSLPPLPQREFASKFLPDDPMFKVVSNLYEVVPEILGKTGKVGTAACVPDQFPSGNDKMLPGTNTCYMF